MKFKKITAACCILALIAGMAGCGKKSKTVSGEIKELTTSDKYPLKTDVELTYYTPIETPLQNQYSSMNDTPFAKELQKQTGIKVKFTHPTVGQENESFSTMIASGSLPDIMDYAWFSYPGGPEKAIAEKVIIPLNDAIYMASPNLKKYYDKHPEASKLMKTDKGNYYMYPFIRGAEIMRVYSGFIVRKDLMDKFSVSEPDTIDDWTNMLKTFKENGVKWPIALRTTAGDLGSFQYFAGAFGVLPDFYVDKNTVKYGPIESGYKDYMATMAGWYKDGLIEPNITDTDSKNITYLMTEGSCGVAHGGAGGSLGTWIPIVEQNGKDIEYTAVKYPSQKSGETPMFGQKELAVSNLGTAISSQCKNVEIAARLLDFGYGEQGQMLYNFGIEGESYNMVDDKPTYADFINNPGKDKSMQQAMAPYVRAYYWGPFIQSVDYIMQYNKRDVQKEAIKVWSKTDADKHNMPYVSLTDSESTEYKRIMQDIDTYKMEYLTKLIAGRESIDTYDNFVKELKEMKIERAIEIQQAAYDRYMTR